MAIPKVFVLVFDEAQIVPVEPSGPYSQSAQFIDGDGQVLDHMRRYVCSQDPCGLGTVHGSPPGSLIGHDWVEIFTDQPRTNEVGVGIIHPNTVDLVAIRVLENDAKTRYVALLQDRTVSSTLPDAASVLPVVFGESSQAHVFGSEFAETPIRIGDVVGRWSISLCNDDSFSGTVLFQGPNAPHSGTRDVPLDMQAHGSAGRTRIMLVRWSSPGS